MCSQIAPVLQGKTLEGGFTELWAVLGRVGTRQAKLDMLSKALRSVIGPILKGDAEGRVRSLGSTKVRTRRLWRT